MTIQLKMFFKLSFLGSIIYSVTSAHLKGLPIRDHGVLHGIEIPVYVTIICFFLVFISEEDSLRCGLAATLLLTSLNVLPSLKYGLLYGTADPLYHLGFTRRILTLCYVPVGDIYSDFPLMHILHTQLSLVTGVSLIEIMKYLLPILMGFTPLVFLMLGRTAFKNENLRKYAVLSSLILYPNYNYAVVAATLAVFLFFCLLFTFFKSRIGLTVAGIILASGIVTSHQFSPIIIAVILVLYSLLGRFLTMTRKNTCSGGNAENIGITKAHFVTFFAVFVFTWFMYTSGFIFSQLADTLSQVLTGLSEIAPPSVGVGLRTMPFETWLRVLIANNVSNGLILATGGIGIFLVLKHMRYGGSDPTSHLQTVTIFNALLFIFACSLVYLVLFVASNTPGFPSLKPQRLMWYTYPPLLVFFSSYFIHWLLEDKSAKVIRSRSLVKVFKVLSLTFVISLSLVTFFPSENVLPITHWYNHVNSIYQYIEVNWLNNHAGSKPVFSDWITSRQLVAFTNANVQIPSLYERRLFIEWYFLDFDMKPPLTSDILFASHYPGEAGVVGHDVQLENRTFVSQVLQKRYANVIYYNGESFVLYLP